MFSLLRTTVTRTFPHCLARPPTAFPLFLVARSQSTLPFSRESDSDKPDVLSSNKSDLSSFAESDNADDIYEAEELADVDSIYEEALGALQSQSEAISHEGPDEQDSFDEVGLPDIPSASTPEKIPRPRDPLLEFFVSALVRHGHRARAQKYVTRTLLNIHTLTRAEALPILREAILIASPSVKMMTKKIPTKNVPVPRALNDRQRAKAAVKWILDQSAKRKGPLPERLAREIIDVVRGESEVLKLKTELHKTAMVNRSNRM